MWTESGERLKDYRDLAEHRVVVSSDVRLYKKEDEKVALFLALPNNPDAASPGEVSFAPPVFAWPYCWEAYVHLVLVVKSVCSEVLKQLDSGTRRAISMGLKGGVQIGGAVGYFPPGPDGVRKRMKRLYEDRRGLGDGDGNRS